MNIGSGRSSCGSRKVIAGSEENCWVVGVDRHDLFPAGQRPVGPEDRAVRVMHGRIPAQTLEIGEFGAEREELRIGGEMSASGSDQARASASARVIGARAARVLAGRREACLTFLSPPDGVCIDLIAYGGGGRLFWCELKRGWRRRSSLGVLSFSRVREKVALALARVG